MARRRPYAALTATLLLSLAIQACSSAAETEDELESFKQALYNAEEAQDFRESPLDVKSKIVDSAPEAILASGTGDVSTVEKCAGEVDEFCGYVKPGENRLSDCLTQQLEEERKGNIRGKQVGQYCKKELSEFKIDRGTNINKNVPLAFACKADAHSLCTNPQLNSSDPTAVLACLRQKKMQGLISSEACATEIFKEQLEGSWDYRVDARLHAACLGDVRSVCKNVPHGEGRIQDCLNENRQLLSWDCQEQLLRQAVENADDIRLSFSLHKKCALDMQRFCPDVVPGKARVKDCLEEHRYDFGFTAECREAFEQMMEARAADYRLDSSLREKCAADIENVCGFEKDSLDTVQGYDGRVITCLRDYRMEITSQECLDQVHTLSMRAAQDIRFDEPLADACEEDIARVCAAVHPGSARVLRCLQDQREDLKDECKLTLFKTEKRAAEDVDYNYPLKRACNYELSQWCADKPRGGGRRHRCLQERVEDAAMSSECMREVVRDIIDSGRDYRLNYQLAHECDYDILKCLDACQSVFQPCGGKVLACLIEKQQDLRSQECRSEVEYVEKLQVFDYRSNVPLAQACRDEIDIFCRHALPGRGHMHLCLQEHEQHLSEACRSEAQKFNPILRKYPDLVSGE